MADAVLVPEDSSDHVSTLSRDWGVQVNTGTKAEPVWTFVYGLTKVNPTTDASMQDDSDIHAGGYKSQLSTALGANLEIEGLRKGTKPGDALVPDPGQEYLRALGKRMGYNNIAQIRVWRTDDLPDAIECNYAVSWKDTAGGIEGLQGFTLSCVGRGKPKDIAKPTVAGAGG